MQILHGSLSTMPSCLDKSNIPSSCKDITDVLENSCFARYLCALKSEAWKTP